MKMPGAWLSWGWPRIRFGSPAISSSIWDYRMTWDKRRASCAPNGGERRAWVAGSTRPGEEAILLEAHQQLLKRYADALLILVPPPPRASQ